jgi:hypothetical protein
VRGGLGSLLESALPYPMRQDLVAYVEAAGSFSLYQALLVELEAASLIFVRHDLLI